jgi:hypothetical protein
LEEVVVAGHGFSSWWVLWYDWLSVVRLAVQSLQLAPVVFPDKADDALEFVGPDIDTVEGTQLLFDCAQIGFDASR